MDTAPPIPLDLTLRLLDDQAALAQLAKARGWSDADLVAHLRAAAAGQGTPISLEQAQATVLYQKQATRRRRKRAWVHSEAADAWRAKLAQLREEGRGEFDLVPWKDEPALAPEDAGRVMAHLVAQGIVDAPAPQGPPPRPPQPWHEAGERPPTLMDWAAQLDAWTTAIRRSTAELASPAPWPWRPWSLLTGAAVGAELGGLGMMHAWSSPWALLVWIGPVLTTVWAHRVRAFRHQRRHTALAELTAHQAAYLPHEVTLGDEALWRTHPATAETWAALRQEEVPILARDAHALNQAVADHQYQAFSQGFDARAAAARRPAIDVD